MKTTLKLYASNIVLAALLVGLFAGCAATRPISDTALGAGGAYLGHELSNGDPLATALPLYARDRRIDVEARSAGVDVLNSALIADFLPFDIARAASLAVLRDVAPIRRLAMRIGGWRSPFGFRQSA